MNEYYNNNYTQENTNSYYQPTQKPEQKKRSGGKIVAMALCFSLLGGAVGTGGTYVGMKYLNENTSETSADEKEITEKETVLLTSGRVSNTLTKTAANSGKLMTASEVYQTNVNADVIELVSMEEAEQMWTPDVSILFVDDVELNTTVAAGIMNQMEIKCDIASSGINAIDMVMNNEYDLVFMDMIMPVMNGTDTMKEIRELNDEKFSSLPIIAMTENVISEDRQKLIEEGFTDVILKPLDKRNLATMIMNNVDRSKVKYRTSDMSQYIKESRYSEGLEKLSLKLDVAKVLEKIGGNINVYNKMLSSFYTRNKNVEEELRLKFHEDYRGFRSRVHAIRTSSGNIGAVGIVNMVSTIEAAVNIGNKTYVSDNLEDFLEMMQDTVDAIGEYVLFVETRQGISDTEFAANKVEEENRVVEEKVKEAKEEKSKEEKAEEDKGVEEENVDDDEKEILQESDLMDIDGLMLIDKYAKDENIEKIREEYDKLMMITYSSDDKDFLDVLGENIKEENYENISELVHTYLDLKS